MLSLHIEKVWRQADLDPGVLYRFQGVNQVTSLLRRLLICKMGSIVTSFSSVIMKINMPLVLRPTVPAVQKALNKCYLFLFTFSNEHSHVAFHMHHVLS